MPVARFEWRLAAPSAAAIGKVAHRAGCGEPFMEQQSKTYVLYTEHHKEDHLAEYLISTIQKTHPEAVSRIYVPKVIRMFHKNDKDGNKIWEERIDVLFYNYIFVETNDIVSFNSLMKTLRIDTGYHLIGKNKINDPHKTYEEYPILPVSDEEMDDLNKLLGSTGIVGKSTFIKEGSHVDFKSGPLKGMEAKVKKVHPSKHVAIIETKFLGEVRKITLAVEKLVSDSETL